MIFWSRKKKAMLTNITINFTRPFCNCYDEDADIRWNMDFSQLHVFCKTCGTSIITPAKSVKASIRFKEGFHHKPKPIILKEPIKEEENTISNVVKFPVNEQNNNSAS